jgi:CRISPR system Cascade subunit CasD
MTLVMLRLAGPMISFGGPRVSDAGPTDRWPYLTMITGMVASSLGYNVAEVKRLKNLHEHLSFAVRCDRAGVLSREFRTISLKNIPVRKGLNQWGWEERRGGDAKRENIIRYDYYLACARYTVAVQVTPGEGIPTPEEVNHALRYPYRALYLGRAAYLPTEPIFLDTVEATSLREALTAFGDEGDYPALWPISEGTDGAIIERSDDKDWSCGLHVGSRYYCEGSVKISARAA